MIKATFSAYHRQTVTLATSSHDCLCFLGGSRYSYPLSETHRKKFNLLKNLGSVHVIGFSADGRPRMFREAAHFYLLPQWPLPVLRYIEFFALAPLILLALIWRYRVNVVIAQSPYEALAAVGVKNLVRCWRYRLCLVVESHNDFETYLFLQRRVVWPGFYKRLMRWVARWTLAQADVLRAVSSSTQAQLQRYSHGQPLVQFAAWTDLESFLAAGQALPEKQPTILYAGVLIPRKGVHHLITAFGRVVQRVPQSCLKIIGRPENPTYARALRQQVEQSHLQDKVAFLAEMPQQKLCYEMAQSTVLVLPSLSEALGRVLLEAMATGTAVIATQVGGIPDIVQEGVNGFLVPPGDEQALAEKMIDLLQHPDLAKAMGQRGRAWVETYFSPHIYLQGYAQICQQCRQWCDASPGV